MKVTGFDLRKAGADAGKNIAFGRVIIEDKFEVEVKIMKGKNGAFVAYPSKQNKDGKWYNQFRWIDREIGDTVQDQIVYWFEKNLGKT